MLTYLLNQSGSKDPSIAESTGTSSHPSSPPPPYMVLALSKARARGAAGQGTFVMPSDQVVCESHKLGAIIESFVAEGTEALDKSKCDLIQASLRDGSHAEPLHMTLTCSENQCSVSLSGDLLI